MEKEILIELIENGLTQREIGLKLDKSQTTVRYWLKTFGLKTKNLKKPRDKKHKCYKCGETNPLNFYGNDKDVCSFCHNKRVLLKAKEKRDYVIKKLGGECLNCGFNDYKCSLDVHHLDPLKKDPNFKSMRGWSLNRIDSEIINCVLLCKNCHAAVHSNLIHL